MAHKDASRSVPHMDKQTETDAAIYQLASIVESSGDAMISKTLDGVITNWNSSAEKLFGYAADEAIGQSMSLVIPPDRQEEWVEIVARLRVGEIVKNYETTRVRKDGTSIEVSVTVSPILDAERRNIGVTAIFHDITEQKRMIEDLATRSQELENSNKKLATRSQQLENSNKKLATRSQELEGSVEELATRSQELEGSVEELATRSQELESSNKKLATRSQELESSNKKLATRTQQLERTRSRLRAIIDASQDAMLLLAPDGRPIEVNTRFTDFFKLDDTTVLAQSSDQMTALLKEQFIDTLLLGRSLARNTADQGHIFREQLVQVGPGGRNFDLYSLPVINVDQTYIGRLYVWHDATQEREVDRMKSEFVALVSHELRTPLTSIKGYVDLLLTDETVGDLTGLQRDFLGVTRNNARRLAVLVNNLLDLSRLESGKLELHHNLLDINLLIGELMPSFQPGWDARRQTFTLHLPEQAPIALGDANRVKQILSNLLSNAHKYTPEGGHIDLSVEAAETVVRIAVTDSGIGLSIEEQAQLFTHFYRAHNALTATIGGTGLGLTICRSLVEMQGGEMQVSSEPGRGSTFRFTLPLAQPLEPPPSPQEALLGKRILVVEDEPDIRHLLRHYLQRAGYEVMTASTGAAAFQLARTARPDLITLDMHLPDSSGLTVLEKLKSDATTASIPVMILSILNDDGKSHMLGAAHYLDKPIKAKALLRQITAIFANQVPSPRNSSSS